MIVKKYPVRTAGESAGYHEKPDKAATSFVLFKNLAAEKAFWIERELDAVSALAPRVLRPYAHIVVALHPDDAEHATDEFFFRVALELRESLGLDRSQGIVWRHTDSDHPHIHLLVNRVTPDGKAVTAWRDMKVMSEFRKRVQARHGLRSVSRRDFEASHDGHDHAGQEVRGAAIACKQGPF